jgi:CheY-like chemotaxis protein
VKLRSRTAAAPAAAGRAPAPAPSAPPSGATLETLLSEVRALRELQEEALALLRARPVADASMSGPGGSFIGDDDDGPAAAPAPVRSRRRKTVLLIDDDAATRTAAKAALDGADVPVRTVDSGNGALAAIAEERPDVIVLELEMEGSMGGKDVINMIKATMEWVDIPIILYTRAAIANQKEARTTHGADEYVLKGPEGASALVARVISVFRRP